MSPHLSREKRTSVFCAAFLLLVLFCVYRPALHGSYLWDDTRHIPNRPSLYTRAGLKLIWTQQGYTQQYYPLMFTTIWMEHHLWGGNTFGYHLVTLGFHAGNAILLALLLSELGFPAAWWVAFLFALHPIQVESVAWMTELKNTQSTFFYLLSLLMLRRFFLPKPEEKTTRRGKYYALGFFFYLCALASKTVSCTLPAVALVLLWYRTDRLRLVDVLGLFPFFATGLALAWITSGFERNVAGAVGPAWDFSVYEHLVIAGRAFWFYIAKILWPYPLNFNYTLWDIHHLNGTNILFPVLAILIFGILWLGRHRWGKGPLAAMAICAVSIAPALGFFHLYPMRFSFVADHFQYQSGISIIVLGVAGIWQFRRELRIGLLTCLCLILGSATWSRAHVFQDPEFLYRDVLNKNPTSLLAMDNLAVTLIYKDRIPEAKSIVEESLRERPDDMDAQVLMGNLLLTHDHRPMAALPYFQKGYRLVQEFYQSHSKEGYIFAMQAQLGETYFEAKQYREAKTFFQAALDDIPALLRQPCFDLTPEVLASSEAQYRSRLGIICEHLAYEDQKSGNLESAAAEFKEALNVNPTDWRMHKSLADILIRQGKNEEAVKEYRQAVDLNPGSIDLSNRLATLLMKLGRKEEAVAVYQTSLSIHSRKPEGVK